ncbi:hypothetical protein GCM10010368_59880 [Streptomyces roseiscleroticus]|uniref:HEAT repeat domain-containing protein n=1 Tax=Streptomyces roseiscleroticus TaxID=1972 RepID=A0ABP5S111_9ACTN
MREVAWYRSQLLPEWEHTDPLPADLTQLDESRLALALCHRDGRIREAAVRRSARYPGLLPLIVIRCADWAEPVRERARKRLREALDAGTAVDLAPLILLVGRRDRGIFGTELLEEVLGRAPRGRLAAFLAHPDRTVRRFGYRLAVERRLLRPAELARAAARDQDTVVQDLCATAALTSLRDEEGAWDEVLAPLLSARGPRTRSAGVTALRRAGRPKQAEPFLADRSALVRACARYVVRQHGGDPAPWYRKRCAAPDDPGLPPGAVIGLAECGNRADAGLLWPLLAHPAAGVRARAVAGLRALDLVDTGFIREPGGTLHSMTFGGKSYSYLTDATGNVLGLVDSVRQAHPHLRLRPHRPAPHHPTEVVPQPYRYAGAYADPTGLHKRGPAPTTRTSAASPNPTRAARKPIPTSTPRAIPSTTVIRPACSQLPTLSALSLAP